MVLTKTPLLSQESIRGAEMSTENLTDFRAVGERLQDPFPLERGPTSQCQFEEPNPSLFIHWYLGVVVPTFLRLRNSRVFVSYDHLKAD